MHTQAVGMRSNRMVSFRTAAMAKDFGVYPGTSRQGMREFLQDKIPTAFSEQETVALPVKGPHGLLRVIIVPSHDFRLTEHPPDLPKYRSLRATGDHHIHLIVLNH